MAINLTDFDKIWASTSPLTPYAFSDNNYKQGWNFVGATPPARQMWDSYMKFSDEKQQFLCDSIFAGNPLMLTADDGNGNTASLIGNPNGTLTWNGNSIPERSYGISIVSTAGQNTYTFSINTNSAVIFAKRGANCSCHMVTYWDSGSTKIFSTGTDPITITKSANSSSVTITNAYSSAIAIKIINGGTL